MKISNNKIGAPTTGKAEGAKSAKADAPNAKKAGTSGAADLKGDSKVAVSDRAQMMAKARDVANQTSDIDEAKVARLQKMIDEGNYSVDADKIADRLVDEHMLIPD